jgi:hypothetical protein
VQPGAHDLEHRSLLTTVAHVVVKATPSAARTALARRTSPPVSSPQ